MNINNISIFNKSEENFALMKNDALLVSVLTRDIIAKMIKSMNKNSSEINREFFITYMQRYWIRALTFGARIEYCKCNGVLIPDYFFIVHLYTNALYYIFKNDIFNKSENFSLSTKDIYETFHDTEVSTPIILTCVLCNEKIEYTLTNEDICGCSLDYEIDID